MRKDTENSRGENNTAELLILPTAVGIKEETAQQHVNISVLIERFQKF